MRVAMNCVRSRLRLPRKAIFSVLLGAAGFAGVLSGCGHRPAAFVVATNAHVQKETLAPQLQNETIVCPLNGQAFDFRFGRFSVARGVTLEMQPYGAPDLPWPLPECPGNGFVVYKQAFSDAEIARLRLVLQQPGFDAQPVYARAYRMAQALGEPLPLQLRLLQMAAWRGGDAYRQQALPLLEQVLADNRQPERTRLDYLLLQAEYLRRLGRFEQAQRSIDAAVAGDPETILLLMPIVQCQQELIAEKTRRPSPVPDQTVQCGDSIS